MDNFMRRFTIQIIDQSFYLFVGEDGYYKWLEMAKRENPHYIYDDVCSGLTGGSTSGRFIWVGNTDDKNLLYHEVSHYLHWLFVELACTNENEFKAYLSAWIHCEIFKYISEVKEQS